MASSNGAGASGERTPLLLLHGFTGTPVMWAPVLHLLEPYHDVYAPHLPGHYLGPELKNPGSNVADALTDTLEEMMDERGWDKAHIVGNSLGGWGALLLADRGRALSTVALSPGGGWEIDSWAHKRIIKFFKMNQTQIVALEPIAYELCARPRSRKILMRDAVAHPERLHGSLAKNWIRAAARCPSWKMLLEHAPKATAPETMDGVEGPVRIAWAERDRILPYEGYSEAWRAVLPDVDWMTMPGVGHVPMSDDPELVARTILEVTAPAAALSS
jgi:pimeloyl-ACP methyl ester carboxylesterase